MYINSGSERGMFLKAMADLEHDDPEQCTVQLPAICPEAFEVSGMTLAQVRRLLAEEFNELEVA